MYSSTIDDHSISSFVGDADYYQLVKKKRMIIAITGASGVGKTSILKEVSENFSEIKM